MDLAHAASSHDLSYILLPNPAARNHDQARARRLDDGADFIGTHKGVPRSS
jgi:hypothetical protein